MTAIIKYIPPMTECISGSLRPEHHFYLMSDNNTNQEIMQWIHEVCQPHTYTYWPELVSAMDPGGWASAKEYFRVSLQSDRAAMLFRLRW